MSKTRGADVYNSRRGFVLTKHRRGLFLVDSALSATIISEEFSVKPPCIASQNNMEIEADVVDENPHVLTEHEIPEPEQTPTNQATDAGLADWEAIGNLHDELLTGKKTVHETCVSEELIRVVERLNKKTAPCKNHARLVCGWNSWRWWKFYASSLEENEWATGNSICRPCMRCCLTHKAIEKPSVAICGGFSYI